MSVHDRAAADRLIADARRFNAQLDASDRQSGFAAPADLPPMQTVKTAAAALEAGLVTQDWTCVAEAFVMLEDLSGGPA